MKTLFSFLLGLFFVSNIPVIAQSTHKASGTTAITSVSQELTKLSELFVDAVKTGNATALDSLCTTNFIFSSPEGDKINKQQFIGALAEGKRTGQRVIHELTFTEAQLQTSGDSAEEKSICTLQMSTHGEKISQRFKTTRTFLKENGRWRVATTQFTEAVSANR